jgi:hypothetical protein
VASYLLLNASELCSSTVGWVLSEIIRKLKSMHADTPIFQHYGYKHIVALKARRSLELLDFWLTQYERPMAPLQLNEDIEVVYSGRCLTRHSIDTTQTARVPHLSDFEILQVIGKGGFSKVWQVRKRDTGMLYAMKVISKSFVIKKGKVEQMLTERRILSRMRHPFVVRLHYAFQTVRKRLSQVSRRIICT